MFIKQELLNGLSDPPGHVAGLPAGRPDTWWVAQHSLHHPKSGREMPSVTLASLGKQTGSMRAGQDGA